MESRKPTSFKDDEVNSAKSHFVEPKDTSKNATPIAKEVTVSHTSNSDSSSSSSSSSSLSASSSSSSSSSSSLSASSSSSSSSSSSLSASSSSSSRRSSDSTPATEKKAEYSASSPASVSDDKITSDPVINKSYTQEEIIAELEKMQNAQTSGIPDDISKVRKGALGNFIKNIDAFHTDLLQDEFRTLKLLDEFALDTAKISYERTVFKTPQREEALKTVREKITEAYAKYEDASLTAAQALFFLKSAVQLSKEAVEQHYKETSWYNSPFYSCSPFGLLFPPQSNVATKLKKNLEKLEAAEKTTPTAPAPRLG